MIRSESEDIENLFNMEVQLRVSLLSSLVVVGLLILCDVSAGSAENTTFIEGVRFGEMKTLVNITGFFIYHMEFDMRDEDTILFSDDYGLKVAVGSSTVILAGAPAGCGGDSCEGYIEGVGHAARFRRVTGFVQLNLTSVIVVDSWNHCLRTVDRESLQTDEFVGNCAIYGFVDGLDARFFFPFSVIKDPRLPNHLLVTDKFNFAVRQVDYVTGNTITLITKSAGMIDPSYITFDIHGEYLIISNRNFIGEKRNSSSELVNIVGNSYGFQDGKLSKAKFRDPQELISLSAGVRLLVDLNNRRLRVLNMKFGSVSSICTGAFTRTDGSVLECGLHGPRSLLVKDGLIYVGDWGAISTLPFYLAETEATTPEIEVTTPETEVTTPDTDTTTPEMEVTTPETEASTQTSTGASTTCSSMMDMMCLALLVLLVLQ